VQLVYDNRHALVIGFGPAGRASDAICSIAVDPRNVNLCIPQGGKSGLRDPTSLLRESGSANRYVAVKSADVSDDPAVRDLMDHALKEAKVPLSRSHPGSVVIKSVSAGQRPRRPA
jgi:hypothetical protein